MNFTKNQRKDYKVNSEGRIRTWDFFGIYEANTLESAASYRVWRKYVSVQLPKAVLGLRVISQKKIFYDQKNILIKSFYDYRIFFMRNHN